MAGKIARIDRYSAPLPIFPPPTGTRLSVVAKVNDDLRCALLRGTNRCMPKLLQVSSAALAPLSLAFGTSVSTFRKV